MKSIDKLNSEFHENVKHVDVKDICKVAAVYLRLKFYNTTITVLSYTPFMIRMIVFKLNLNIRLIGIFF